MLLQAQETIKAQGVDKFVALLVDLKEKNEEDRDKLMKEENKNRHAFELMQQAQQIEIKNLKAAIAEKQKAIQAAAEAEAGA